MSARKQRATTSAEIMKKEALKCSQCGKFVSFQDVNIKMITPDSEYTYEEYEVLCPKCKQNIKTPSNRH